MTITNRILVQIAAASGLVILVASGATYRLVYLAAEKQGLEHLSDYVAERARVEETKLQHIQENLEMVRGQFLQANSAPTVARGYQEQWDYFFEKYPDGAWRSRRTFSDGRKWSTLWLHKDVVLTPELQTQILRANNICNSLLRSWVDSFPSLYFIFPCQANMGFDPRIPNWVWDTPADYDNNAIEAVISSNLQNNPARQIVWNCVLEEPTSRLPYIAVMLPIDMNGTNVATVGHDIHALRLLDDVTRSSLRDVTHFIFRQDGRLIAHREKMKEILASNGRLTMVESGDSILKNLYNVVRKSADRRITGHDELTRTYYAVSRLAGPEWFFATIMPGSALQQQAFQSARWVLWSGLLSLALVLWFFATILRRQIALPLAELARATGQMRGGDTAARANIATRDELGALATSFNQMSESVATRDAELRRLNQDLERQVDRRTVELRDANRDLKQEVEQRSLVEASLNERVRIMALGAEVAGTLNEDSALHPMLQRCAASFVQHLDAAFARVWVLNESAQVLELVASAGCYTHLDGPHSRVAVGQFKIGLIAQERRPHLSNDVLADPRVSDKEWARRENMVAFAGYPLLLEGRVLGVMALFARHPLGKESLEALGGVAPSIALGIERKRAARVQRATYDIAQATHTTEDPDTLYARIHEIVKGLMPASNFFLLLHDPAIDRHFYAYHVDEMDPKPPPRRISGGLNSYVLRTGSALLAHRESMTDPDSEWHMVSGTPAAVWLGVPLIVRGRSIGVMAVQDYHNSQAYGQEEKQILSFVAAQTAVAIDRKRAEVALAESETRTRLVIDTALDAVITMDSYGVIRGWNVQAERTFGWPADEAMGRPLSDTIIPPAFRDAHTRGLKHFLKTGQGPVLNKRIEITAVHRDGHEFPVELAITPLRVGSTWIFSGFARDITERKRTEAELLKTVAREKELNELKGNFVSMVSHEFRTPLGVIQSASDVLDRYLDRLSPEKRRRHLDMIFRSTKNLAQLIDGVLLLGKVEDGRMQFTPVPIDVVTHVHQLVEEVHSATGRHAPIEVIAGSGLENARSDTDLLRHILTNLLSNAVKYSGPGAPVHLAIERSGLNAVFTIRDQGIGISAEDQKNLFKSFSRGSNVGQRPGTGLGLVIVQRCVQLHGGSVHLESETGRGTSVAVTLPMFPS